MTDKHLSWFERAFKRLNINRCTRMHKHYAAIKDEVKPRSAREEKEVRYFKKTFMQYYTRTMWLLKIRLALYVFLSASVIVSFLPFLSFLIDIVKLRITTGVTLSSVFIVLVLFVTSKINLHLELMNESLTHLIAIYHRSEKRDTEKVLDNLSRTL